MQTRCPPQTVAPSHVTAPTSNTDTHPKTPTPTPKPRHPPHKPSGECGTPGLRPAPRSTAGPSPSPQPPGAPPLQPPLTALAGGAGPAGGAEAVPAVVAEPPVLAGAALPAAGPVPPLGAGWERAQGRAVILCTLSLQNQSQRDRLLVEPIPWCCWLCPYPARRPAPSSPRGRRSAPWRGRTSPRSGTGSARGSVSRRNPPGMLRGKQGKTQVRKQLRVHAKGKPQPPAAFRVVGGHEMNDEPGIELAAHF